jgi:hypothetical protein
VQTALATPLEFEVLDGIGDEDLDPIEAGVSGRAVENAAGPTKGRPRKSSSCQAVPRRT